MINSCTKFWELLAPSGPLKVSSPFSVANNKNKRPKRALIAHLRTIYKYWKYSAPPWIQPWINLAENYKLKLVRDIKYLLPVNFQKLNIDKTLTQKHFFIQLPVRRKNEYIKMNTKGDTHTCTCILDKRSQRDLGAHHVNILSLIYDRLFFSLFSLSFLWIYIL